MEYWIFLTVMSIFFALLIPRIFECGFELARWAVEGWIELAGFIRNFFRKDV